MGRHCRAARIWRPGDAILARHDRTEIPLSKVKVRIAEILKEEGFIRDFRVDEREVEWSVARSGAITPVAMNQMTSVTMNGTIWPLQLTMQDAA